VEDVDAALHKIENLHHEIKKELAAKVRHQLRSIPVLKFLRTTRWIMFSKWKKSLKNRTGAGR
jgi:hypothetical protein